MGFLRWAFPFAFDRLDKRADRVDAREREVDRRFNLRLKHLELELDCFRAATMRLLNVVAEIAPGHGALAEVATMLRKIPPRASMDVDELAAKLAAMPGTNQGGN